MKIDLCAYSGYKIYPGHGSKVVKLDGRVFNFLNSKCKRGFMLKRNPREIPWTILYRRKNKKGVQEELNKKTKRKKVKYQRPVGTFTVQDILARRNQKPEVRKAQREQAIRAAKEKQKAKDASKKAVKVAAQQTSKKSNKSTKSIPQQKVRVGGKR